MNLTRLNKTLSIMNSLDIEHIIISEPTTLFYLTGEHFHPQERCCALYIHKNGRYRLLINSLFVTKPFETLHILPYKDTENPMEVLSTCLESNATLGIDGQLPSRFLIAFQTIHPNMATSDCSLVLEKLRATKDTIEQDLLRKSSEINCEVLNHVVDTFSPEMSETDVARSISTRFSEKNLPPSFSPIVAYGLNSSDPHHVPVDLTQLKKGDSILIDMGCIYQNYCSDMTRTLFFKSVSPDAAKIYNSVLEANLAAIKAVKPGIKISEIDRAARTVIDNAGYGKYFTHRTGHSLGLDIHEKPNAVYGDDTILEVGMCFSIEPGIYHPEICGVRIEDLVIVTETGCEVITTVDKSLQCIG